MKRILVIMMIVFFSCGYTVQGKNKNRKHSAPVVGEKVYGDFDGDGKRDMAAAIQTREAQGNPVEDGTPAAYEIRFSSGRLKTIAAGCCGITLINEGDLNNDGTDELSVFQAPMNGCTYSMTTYSYSRGAWGPLVASFLIPTGCENTSNADLQKRVFKEGNTIYYLATDPNDEEGRLIKKKVPQ